MSDDEFDFTRFELGDEVTVTHDGTDGAAQGSTTVGTIVRIDYDDPNLPWGVSIKPVTDPNSVEWDEVEFNWFRDDNTAPSHYVDLNFVIQEETNLASCW